MWEEIRGMIKQRAIVGNSTGYSGLGGAVERQLIQHFDCY